MVTISCIIPTHNRADRLTLLLASIVSIKQNGYEIPAFIHVVENGSQVASEVANEFTVHLPVKYHYEQIGNKSLALNRIIEEIPSSHLILFFDDDVEIIDMDIFEQYRTAATKHGVNCFYGGEVIPNFEIEPEPVLVPYMPQSNTGIKFNSPTSHIMPGTKYLGCNWAVFHIQLKHIGGFSRQFGPGSVSKARGKRRTLKLDYCLSECNR